MTDDSTHRYANISEDDLRRHGANVTTDYLLLNSLPRFVGEEIPDIARHSFIVLGVFLMISGTFGNVLVLVTLVRCPSLHSIHYVYVANLAIADLIIEAYSSPFVMYDLILGYQPVVNNAHCVFNGFLVVTCYVTSLWTLASISFNRYMHVCQHTLYKRYVTRRLTLFLCAMVWVLSIAVGAAPLLGWGSYQYDLKTHYCGYERTASISYTALISVGTIALPASAVCYFNFAIFRYVKQAKIKLEKWDKSGNVKQGHPGMEESRAGDQLGGDFAKPQETEMLETERRGCTQGSLRREQKVRRESVLDTSDNGESSQTQTSNLCGGATPLMSPRSTLGDIVQHETTKRQTLPPGSEVDAETSFNDDKAGPLFFLNDNTVSSHPRGCVSDDFMLLEVGEKFLIPGSHAHDSQDCDDLSLLCVSADEVLDTSGQGNIVKSSNNTTDKFESVDADLAQKVLNAVQNSDENCNKEKRPSRECIKSPDVSKLNGGLMSSETKHRKRRRIQLLPHKLNIPHSNIYRRHNWLDLNSVSSGRGFHDPDCHNVRCEFLASFQYAPDESPARLFSTETSQTGSQLLPGITPIWKHANKVVHSQNRRPCYLDLPQSYSCPSLMSNCDICWNGKHSSRHYADGCYKSDTFVTAHAPYRRPQGQKPFRFPRPAILVDRSRSARAAKRPISLKELSMIKTLFAVFVCLAIFMSPYMVTVIVDTTNKWSALVHSTCSHLAVVNNAINWMLYGLLNKSFRVGYRQVLTSILPKKHQKRS